MFYNIMAFPCLKNLPIKREHFISGTFPTIVILVSFLVLLESCQKNEKAYFGDGKIKYIIPKDWNNRIDGQAKWWYENGVMQISADYKKGELHGKVIRYYENGMKQSEASYLDNMLNGISLDYNANGRVIVEKTYRNDTLNGICRQYDDQGQKIVEGSYKDGFFEGRWLYYSNRGILIGEANFTRGSGSKVTWNEEGKIIGRASYLENLRNGEEVWYGDEDQITRIRTFKSGELVADSVISIPGQ